jgi:hypothetical protein
MCQNFAIWGASPHYENCAYNGIIFLMHDL